MASTYRIEGTASPDAFLEASAAADAVLTDLAGTKNLSNFSGWLTYMLALGGAVAVMFLLFLPMIDGVEGLSPTVAQFGMIFIGIAVVAFVLNLLNGIATQRFAKAWCDDPLSRNGVFLIGPDGVTALASDCQTRFAWGDVTRIEATPKTIVVMAGFSWCFIPLNGFKDVAQAKAAIADMRAWQAAAQA